MKTLKRIYFANMLTAGALRDRAEYLKMVKEEKNVYTLETFFKTNSVTRLFEQNLGVKIFLDSGAFSLINKNTTITCDVEMKDGMETVVLSADDFFKLPDNDRILLSARKLPAGYKHRYVGHSLSKQGVIKSGALKRFIDYSFNESQEVKDYFEKYIDFIHKWRKNFYTYVNLDVIFNPQKSWDNQKYMESCGLNPIPVYHFGEDIKWLKKYMDDYEYIGVGGLGRDVTKERFIATCGDETFRYILQSKQKVKIHGFAVTAFDLLRRYPWYTVDSTTWVKHAAYGNVLVPGFNGLTGEFDINLQPIVVYVSQEKGTRRMIGGEHFTQKYIGVERERLLEYFGKIDVNVEKMGVDLFERTRANVRYFQLLLEEGLEVDMSHLVVTRRTFF